MFWALNIILCENETYSPIVRALPIAAESDSVGGLLSELSATTCGLTISFPFIAHSNHSTLWRWHSLNWTIFKAAAVAAHKNEAFFIAAYFFTFLKLFNFKFDSAVVESHMRQSAVHAHLLLIQLLRSDKKRLRDIKQLGGQLVSSSGNAADATADANFHWQSNGKECNGANHVAFSVCLVFQINSHSKVTALGIRHSYNAESVLKRKNEGTWKVSWDSSWSE